MSNITVCPACDSANIQHNHAHGYRCWDCEETFREPRIRESRARNQTLHGLAKKLAEADASEVCK